MSTVSALVEGIVKYIELGVTKEKVKKKVIEAGYSVAEFEIAYGKALTAHDGGQAPAPVATPEPSPAAVPAPTPVTAPEPVPAVSPAAPAPPVQGYAARETTPEVPQTPVTLTTPATPKAPTAPIPQTAPSAPVQTQEPIAAPAPKPQPYVVVPQNVPEPAHVEATQPPVSGYAQQEEKNVPPATQVPPVSAPVEPVPAPAATAAPIVTASQPKDEIHVPEDGSVLMTPVAKSSKTGMVVGLVIFVSIVLGGGLAYASATGLITLPSVISNLWETAPYDESIIAEELSDAFADIRSASYAATIRVQMGLRDEDVYAFPKAAAETSKRAAYQASFSTVPTDFTLLVELSGQFDLENLAAPNGHTQFAVAIESDDFNMNADVEFIVAEDEGVFGRVNRMPTLLADISAIKEQWIHLFDSNSENSPFKKIEEMPNAQRELVFTLMRDQYALFLEIASKHNVLLVSGDPVKEKIGDVSTYKYTLNINPDTSRPFFEDVQQRFEEEYGSDHMLTAFALEDNIDTLSNPEYIRYFNTHWPISVWATADGVPVRIGTDARLVLDDMPMFDDKQLNLSIHFDLSNINEPVVVEVPADAMTLEEAAEKVPMLGILGSLNSARSKGEDASSKAQLNNLRAMAELYWDDASGSYLGFCDSIGGDEYDWFNLSDTQYVCNDSIEAWAGEAALTEGYYCVDSSGLAQEFGGSVVQDTVCDLSPLDSMSETLKNRTPKVPAVNTSQ